ncbi:delta 1-pyrroline-5-carboxylate reductase, partial [Tulasnella sp. 403]
MGGMNRGSNTANPPRLPKKPNGSHQPGRSMSPDPWGLQDLRMPRQQGTPRTPAMPVHGLPVAPEHTDGSVPKGASLPEVSQRKRVRNESSDSAGGGTEHISKKRRDDASGRAEDSSQYHANGRNQTHVNSGKELPTRSRHADTQAAKRLDPGVARQKMPMEYGPEERKLERLDRGRTLEPRSFGGAQDDRYSSVPPYASYGPDPSPPNGPRRQYGPPVPAVDRRPVRYNDRSPYRRSPSPDDRRHDHRPRPSSPPPRRDPYYPPNGLPSRLDRPPYRDGGSSDRYYRDQHRYLPPRSPPPDARIRKRSLTPERPRSPRRRDAPPPRTSGSHSPTARRRSLSSGPSQRTQEPKPSSSPTATSPKGAPVEVSTPQATAPAGAGLGLSVDGVAKQAQGTVLSADLASRITGMDNILSSVGGASPQRHSPTLEGRIQSPTLAQRVSEIPKNAVVVANGSAGASLAARMTDHRTAPLATRLQIETPKPTPVHAELFLMVRISLGCGTMGVAITSGIIAGLEARSQSQPPDIMSIPSMSSSGIATPTTSIANAADAAIPTRFIACVSRHESGKKLRRTFADLGEMARDIEVVVGNNLQAIQESDVILLCCKPQLARSILGEPGIKEALDQKLLISILAGVTIAQLEGWVLPTTRVVRAMPNTPCRIREGMTVVTTVPHEHALDRQIVLTVFSSIGRCRFLDEKHFDACTALSGSGPAFVCLVLEAMADGGVMMGLPRSEALELAAQTLQGTARMALQSGAHPAEIKDSVTTPGGCTIAGLLTLEDGRVRSTMARAIQVATQHAAALGQPSKTESPKSKLKP